MFHFVHNNILRVRALLLSKAAHNEPNMPAYTHGNERKEE